MGKARRDRNREPLRAGARRLRASTHKRRTDMSRYLAFAFALFAVTLAACNTVAGAGQDISKGGQAISNEAEKAK
jgi:entericidin B